MSKGQRYLARAIRYYITMLNTALEHCCEDETASIANNIGLYLSILENVEANNRFWPND